MAGGGEGQRSEHGLSAQVPRASISRGGLRCETYDENGADSLASCKVAGRLLKVDGVRLLGKS